MVISGCIQNGVVVLQAGVSLPEGAPVAVVYYGSTQPSADRRLHAAFPLVRSARPGSIDLTNDRIAELLNEEDVSP